MSGGPFNSTLKIFFKYSKYFILIIWFTAISIFVLKGKEMIIINIPHAPCEEGRTV